MGKMGFSGSGNKHIQFLRWALVGNLRRGPGESCKRVVGRSMVSWETHGKCGAGCRHDMGDCGGVSWGGLGGSWELIGNCGLCRSLLGG